MVWPTEETHWDAQKREQGNNMVNSDPELLHDLR
jgi:hypothetical protein